MDSASTAIYPPVWFVQLDGNDWDGANSSLWTLCLRIASLTIDSGANVTSQRIRRRFVKDPSLAWTLIMELTSYG